MVNIYKQELTQLQQEIFRLLCAKSGMSLNQRGIAHLLKVSSPAVMKAIPELEKLELIKVEQDKESKRWAITLNRDNYKVMQLKRIENLRQIYELGFVDFLEKELAGATIIIFGSYSRGEDTIKSDIDIAIIGRKEKDIELTKFEKILERNIFINFYPSFKEIHKNLRENIFNGIVLIGGVEL
ncbi:MAG: nucleotidyltransferase domain-containing protein [Nanoarchaeota archaeon]|nr:nucleotidyltransferase domain-containing protein [Nanoarchaeota archaeon]